jgi:hypothetical protein
MIYIRTLYGSGRRQWFMKFFRWGRRPVNTRCPSRCFSRINKTKGKKCQGPSARWNVVIANPCHVVAGRYGIVNSFVRVVPRTRLYPTDSRNSMATNHRIRNWSTHWTDVFSRSVKSFARRDEPTRVSQRSATRVNGFRLTWTFC